MPPTEESAYKMVQEMTNRVAKEQGWTKGNVVVVPYSNGFACGMFEDVGQNSRKATSFGLKFLFGDGEMEGTG